VGEIVAVGIFLTPAGMAKSLGSPFWVLMVWIAMGVMSWCGALCFSELAVRFPEAGGLYPYLREAFGPMLAFLYGWMALLVMDPGLTALLATGAAKYMGYSFSLGPRGIRVSAIIAIAVLALVNIRGVRLGGWFVRWLTILKIGVLAFIVGWAFVLQKGQWSNFVPFVSQRPGSTPLTGALAGGIVAAFFSFAGWWDITKVSGEVRDPAGTMPRAFTLGIAIVTLVYIVTSAAFIFLVPIERVTDGQTFAAQAGEALFGHTGGRLFSFAVIVAVAGSLAAVIMCAPRVYFAMARDGLFFSAAAKIHPRYGTPVLSIAIQAILASLLVMLGSFEQILSYFFFVVLIFIALIVCGLFRLRRRGGAAPAYLTPGYPLTPAVFLFLVLLMLVLLAAGQPKQSLWGVIVVALGIPIYYFWFRSRTIIRANEAASVD